jgi:anti-anti-sigma factor
MSPAEIDAGNADETGGQLHVALRPGTAVVIADMSATTFADSSAVRALLTDRDTAATRNIDLRLAIPAPAVLRILHALDIATILQIYPASARPSPLRRTPASKGRPARERHPLADPEGGRPGLRSRPDPPGTRVPAGWRPL